MPRKAYSENERIELKARLLDTALELFSQQGLEKVTLNEILRQVGISKPFFYTFYRSVDDLLLGVLNQQRDKTIQMLYNLNDDKTLDWKEKNRILLRRIAHYKESGMFFITREQQQWLTVHMSPGSLSTFRASQTDFFQLLSFTLGIPVGKISPNVLLNLIFTLAMIRNSCAPLLKTSELDESADIYIEMLIQYFESLRA